MTRRELTQRLVDLIQLEERIYRELAALLRGERELILSMDAAGLGELVRKKEALAAEARLAEESRLEISQRLARTLGLIDEPITLRLLCEHLGEGEDHLRDAQTRLVALVGAVRELVDANRTLGGERLTRVQTTLRLLGRLLPLAAESTAPRDSCSRPAGRLLRTSA